MTEKTGNIIGWTLTIICALYVFANIVIKGNGVAERIRIHKLVKEASCKPY